MRSGKGIWRGVPPGDRVQAISDALNIVVRLHPSARIFASVIKKSVVSPDDPVDLAFEQLASRFDKFLMRLHKRGHTHRGVVIFDKTSYEETIQSLATDFRTIGHSWGVLRNFAEVPLFLDSKASRLIQLADLIAFAIFRNYEANDPMHFEIIKNCFDSEGGIVHGFHVRT